MPKLPYIKLFSSLYETAREMTDDEAGRLFKAILQYAYGEEPSVGGAERYVFLMLRSQIDRDAEAYAELSDKRSAIGRKGGRPKTGTDEKPICFSGANGADEKAIGFSEKQKKQLVFRKSKKSNCLQEEDKDKDKDKEEEEEEEYIYDDDDGTRTREDTPPPGNDVPPGVVAYIDANIGNLTPGNYNELAALMADGMPDDLIQYAVDAAVKAGARNAAYVFGILRRMRDEGIKSVGDAKRAEDAHRRKRDAETAARNGGRKRVGCDFAERDITDAEFESGFYVDPMAERRMRPNERTESASAN